MLGVVARAFHLAREKKSSANRIPRSVCRLNSYGDQAPFNQNQTNPSGSSQVSKAKNCFSPHALTTTGKDECDKLCPSSRAPALPPPANGTNEHTGAELPMLRSTSPSNTRVSRGAGMVEQQYVQVEWQNPHTKGHRPSD